MSKQLPQIDAGLADWIARQRLFFVATAPLSTEHHVNCSPKGGDSFRVLGPLEVAYLDYTGSGAETAAHLRENGRIVILFCAFEGPPKIVRLHGKGSVVSPHHPRFTGLASRFPSDPGTRSIVHIAVGRVSSSCGFSVPLLDYRGDRETLTEWSAAQGTEKLDAYREQKNSRSIDGLPAFSKNNPCGNGSSRSRSELLTSQKPVATGARTASSARTRSRRLTDKALRAPAAGF
jgi:hypothetical protein